MNASHAIGGTVGTSITAMLTVVLQNFQKIDPATAAAEAGLIVLALGAVAGLLQRVLPNAASHHAEDQHAQ